MPKAAEYRTSAAQYDGAMPLLVASPSITVATTAVANKGQQMVPFNCTIQKAYVAVQTAITSGHVIKVNIGTSTDADKFVDAWPLTTGNGKAAGLYEIDLTSTAAWKIGTAVLAGQIVEFGMDLASTAAGTFGAAMVLSPNA